ncbi:TauD-domain-containing protein [Parathielavia hyrcaniae]|uniref:TauD-domain-containing protein n=1 Tax=Parathielavia hyrcaniae TaxID=113614 RepID=A0AAN6Q0W3_9PEZI|nr:TauD-domain-containing protein [Parathielavia hyrcaniae]
MAPSAVEVETPTVPDVAALKLQASLISPYRPEKLEATKYDTEAEAGLKSHKAAKNRNDKYPPLEPFEHYEHGKDADPSYPNLLPEGAVQVTHLTPTIGTEVRGIQLSALTSAGKDELALEFGSYFGRHHIHPTSGAPAGYPEIHLVHRGAGDDSIDKYFAAHTSTVVWHSDVSYEQQPPGTTFLYALERPSTRGDTLFANAAEAYNRLSPLFQRRLHGLEARHSAVEQANDSVIRGGIKRREPVINEHPIVRTHFVTGEKAIYVNPQFTRDIVGLKKEESDAILKFLYGADVHARVKWEERTVVVGDNRLTQHSALVGWKDGQRRHLARITPQAERPFETPFEK